MTTPEETCRRLIRQRDRGLTLGGFFRTHKWQWLARILGMLLAVYLVKTGNFRLLITGLFIAAWTLGVMIQDFTWMSRRRQDWEHEQYFIDWPKVEQHLSTFETPPAEESP